MVTKQKDQKKICFNIYEEQNKEVYDYLNAIRKEQNKTSIGALEFLIKENSELRSEKKLEERVANATHARFKKDLDSIRNKANGADATGYYNLYLLNNLVWNLLGDYHNAPTEKIYNHRVSPHLILERAEETRERMIKELLAKKAEKKGLANGNN